MESLRAAIENGANAIYLGGRSFSARASAKNFDREELAEALLYAHFRDVKIYVTVNTILDDQELEESLEYIDYLYRIGVDAIIIQDLGLIKILRKNYPDLDLHGSTQMTINSLEGALVLEELGFSRVVLARETPLEEIKLISKQTDLEIEFFAHGALCVSYSGQCLMSSMIGGRSGNRGRCAQPCRRSYQVVDKDGPILDIDRAYLLSPKDLNTSEYIEELKEAGVTSLKIEGRMKRPDYVATVTSIYRQAIDKIAKADQEVLAQAFNRGFTKGLPLGDFGSSYANPYRQNNQGIKVGKVISQKRGRTKMTFDRQINKDDLLEFVKINRDYQSFKAPGDYEPGTANFVIPFDVKEESIIRRIIDQRQLDLAKKSYEKDSLQRNINFYFKAHEREYPSLEASDDKFSVQIQGPEKVQAARKAPMTSRKIYDQLDRLGESPYILGDVEIDIGDNIFLPVSIINDMRRSAVDGLLKKLEKSYQRPSRLISYKKPKAKKASKDISLSLSFSKKSQIKDIDFTGVDRVYLRFIDKDLYRDLLDQGIQVYYRLAKILHHQDYINFKEDLKNISNTGIVIDNLGGFAGFVDQDIIGDYGLNVFNSTGADLTRDIGATSIIASPELTLDQLSIINSHTYQELEALAYGFVRLMTMKHCPFSTIKNCSLNHKDCKNCKFRQGHLLRDEMGIDFPTERVEDYSLIYNSYPISMLDKLDDLIDTGVSSILLDFTIEERPKDIIQAFKDRLHGRKSSLNDKLIQRYGNINYGHYYRGIE